jgi:hypothetical protein
VFDHLLGDNGIQVSPEIVEAALARLEGQGSGSVAKATAAPKAVEWRRSSTSSGVDFWWTRLPDGSVQTRFDKPEQDQTSAREQQLKPRASRSVSFRAEPEEVLVVSENSRRKESSSESESEDESHQAEEEKRSDSIRRRSGRSFDNDRKQAIQQICTIIGAYEDGSINQATFKLLLMALKEDFPQAEVEELWTDLRKQGKLCGPNGTLPYAILEQYFNDEDGLFLSDEILFAGLVTLEHELKVRAPGKTRLPALAA